MKTYLRFRDRLSWALDQRLYQIDYLDRLFLTGLAQIWHNGDSAIVAGIRIYPSGAKVICGLCACGNLHAIERLIPLAEQWGREQGCIGAIIESRPGWMRGLNDYTPFQTALWKEL